MPAHRPDSRDRSRVPRRAGATTLLAATRLTDWTVRTAPLAVGTTAVVVRIETFQIGLVFAAPAFLAQQRRIQRTPGP